MGKRAFFGVNGWALRAFSLSLVLLLIEFFDELHFGVAGAALPVLRAELSLSYAQAGLLLGLPAMVGALIEPGVMLLGDTPLRRRLILSGGLAFGLASLLIGAGGSFGVLLLAFTLLYPASGAFVSLAQATLMDEHPGREAQWMARWTVFGSLGNLGGPLLLAGSFALGWGWRWAFLALAGGALLLALALTTRPFPAPTPPSGDPHRTTLPRLWKGLGTALRDRRLVRWLILLNFSDLLLDVFTGYMVLYFTDVAGATPAQASLVLGLVMFASLLADLLVIPLLERVPGRRLVRLSAAIALLIYPAWLLAPWAWAKVLLVVALRLSTLGWYPVLQGEAYASLPGRSGTVMAATSLAGLGGGALAWLVGWAAGQAGLETAMWLLLLGPLSLVLFVPPPGGDE